MNVVVMGSGGVGGYYGALLARAGHQVTFIARGAHLQAMQRHGLRVETVAEPHFTVHASALEAPGPDFLADLILLAVKSYDTEEAIQIIAPAVGPETTILTFQNGVDSGELLAGRFGAERVLDGVVYIESAVREPGVIAQLGGLRRVFIGRRREQSTEGDRRLFDAFKESSWLVELAGNIESVLWTKLTFIGPFAAVGTVTALPAAKLRDDPTCLGLLREMMTEYAAVASAEGVVFDEDPVARGLATLANFPPGGLSSMLRDRMAGKRIEAGALVDTIVSRGDRLRIPTPVTGTLSRLLAPMRDGASQPVS